MTVSRLVTFLEARASDQLRGVARYKGNENDVLCIRDGIKEHRIQSQFGRIIDRLRPESAPGEERAFQFGDLCVTIRRFDDAIIMHFPRGPDHGVVVVLESETVQDLNQFTNDCLQRINGD